MQAVIQPLLNLNEYQEIRSRLPENRGVLQLSAEDIFLNYVLFHRVNDEEVIPCRSFFYDKIKDRVKGLCGKEEILELNYWCAEEVTYHAGDERTLPRFPYPPG